MSNDEQGEADRLRVKWMGMIGHSREDIDVSLRFNRPQSAAEERQYLHIVEETIAEEMKYPPEHRMPFPSEVA